MPHSNTQKKIRPNDPAVPPVAFFIFNRPEYTAKVFEEIRQARPSQLFVIADGPRHSAEKTLCEKTRAVIHVDWDCTVLTNYADENLGLKKRIPSGLDWFFEHVEAGMILEDDCLPDPSFFRFAGEMLERYRNNPKVLMITGDNFLPNLSISDSYFFSRFFSIWGWATWRRSWRLYDPKMSTWSEKSAKQKIAEVYPETYMHEHVKSMFDRAHAGTLHSWDPQWLYTCLMHDGLCVAPSKNLISNIGLHGTHSDGDNQNLPTTNLYATGALKHPQLVAQNVAYDHAFYEKNFRPLALSPLQKIHAKIKKMAVHSKGIKFTYRTLLAYRNKLTRRFFGVVSVSAKTRKRGEVLLSYLTSPFTCAPWQYFTDPHTNYWECAEIARLFAVRGYDVDIIDANNTHFIPKKSYAVVVDVRQNLQRFCTATPTQLPAHCKKVMHITSSDSTFQNTAEAERLAKLLERRGATLTAQRIESGAENPSYADYLEGFGNKTVHATFARFQKPIHPIPISVTQTFELFDIEKKDFSEARNHFLFFSGGGAILKGLDLVVEAFATMPDAHLHIIGPAAYEKEFQEAYKTELALPNITRYPRPKITKNGDITVGDTTFLAVANKCATLIYPSASEGTSGAVIQAMHAGVFPIVTKQTGLSEDAPAIILEKPTVESVRLQVKKITQTQPAELKKMAIEAWTYAREHHTKEHFSFAYGQYIDDILRQ